MSIYEGVQFHLGRLDFGGNTTTKDKVLRREIFIEEGDVMDMEAFKQSIYKLGQLGYFKASDNPDFKVNPDKKTVDVTIKGDEQGKNDVQFGGGYSEGAARSSRRRFPPGTSSARVRTSVWPSSEATARTTSPSPTRIRGSSIRRTASAPR